MLDLDESKENKFKMLLNESVTDYTTTAISRIVVQKVIDLIKNHEPVQEYILFTKDEIPGNDRFDVDFLCVKVKESEEISKIYSSGATSYLNSVQVENSLKKTLEKVINFLREVPENIGNLAGLAEFCDKYLSESATSDILDILGIYLNTRDESLLKKVELFLVSYYETEKKSLMKNIVINYAPYVPKNLIDEILDNPKRFLKTVEVEIIIPPELYGKSKNGKYRTLALAVEFVVELKSTLTHELTHTRQHKRNEENIDDPKNFKDFKDVTEYLKEPKEVEAFVADCYKKAKMLKRNLYDVMKDLFYAEKDRIEIERKENKKNPYYMVTEQQILSAWDEWVEFAKKKYPQVKSPEDVSKRSQLDMIDLDEVWRRIKNA
ncbi:hypothetical protein M0R19_04265 [Candidatus Pacearchaeota archaeon]|nr:hypothetical protein [Candidatus Pacearchaeota archaeon]